MLTKSEINAWCFLPTISTQRQRWLPMFTCNVGKWNCSSNGSSNTCASSHSTRLRLTLYNWWSLYARLVNPDKHHEAVTSRPLMLQSIGRKTTHAGQTIVTVTSTHAKAPVIQAAMQELARFFKELSKSAEQLDVSGRIKLIALRAFSKLLASFPPQPTAKMLPATG